MKPIQEPKIVKQYKQLFDEGNVELINSDEFFLLRPNTFHLGKILDGFTPEEFQAKQFVTQAIVTGVFHVLEAEQGLKLFNACQTLSVVAYHVGKNNKNIAHATCLLLPSTPEAFGNIFSQRFRDVILGDSSFLLKKCFVNTLGALWQAFPSCHNNSLMFALANNEIFDALIFVAVHLNDKTTQYEALRLIAILLRVTNGDRSNGFVQCLSKLEDNISLIGFGQLITELLTTEIEHFTKLCFGDKSGVLSAVTSKVFDLFTGGLTAVNNVPHNNLALLLFLNAAVPMNRNFAIMLTSPPQTQNITDPSSFEPSAYVNATVFSIFLSFASYTFAHFEKPEQREQSMLCLKILRHMAAEPYVQSAMQDIHLATAVALYKSPMRHRPASYEPVMSTLFTLSTALLELLTDFNSTHLMVQFPFSHYHYSLSILHYVLIYHKKCRIRLQSWRPLFNSLVSLIDFLTKTAKKVHPTNGVFRLIARVLLVLNFFITYGDTFLPDAAAYDSLYYEISRQNLIFLKLSELAEESKTNPIFEGSDESLIKVNNHLLNILSIIEHVRPKLEVLARSYPSEEQVIAIVQECFNGLTLKLYDGLEVVEHYEEPDAEATLTNLTQKITLENDPHWAESLIYCTIADDLSAIE